MISAGCQLAWHWAVPLSAEGSNGCLQTFVPGAIGFIGHYRPLLNVNLLNVNLHVFSPYHFIYYAHVTLDDADDFGGYVFIYIVGHGDAGEAVLDEAHGHFHALQQALGIDAAQDEAAFVQGFGALGAGADAHGRERVTDAGEEAALLGQGAGVGDHAVGVHLQAVVVVKAQGLVLDDALVQLEAAGLQALAAAGVAAVEDGHVVLLGHLVDGGEQAQEVLLGVNILLAVGAEKDVLALLQAQALVDVAGLYLLEVAVQDLGHGAAGDVGALLGEAGVGQVAAGVLAVGHVHVGDDVHDAAVGLLGQALVLAAVAGLHVEDGDVQPLGPDDAEAAVGVAQHQHGIGLGGDHQLVALGNDVAHGLAQVVAHSFHVDVGIGQLEVLEEHPIEVVVVVLPGMRQQTVKVRAALVNHRRQPYNLWPRAHDDQELQLPIFFKFCHYVRFLII